MKRKGLVLVQVTYLCSGSNCFYFVHKCFSCIHLNNSVHWLSILHDVKTAIYIRRYRCALCILNHTYHSLPLTNVRPTGRSLEPSTSTVGLFQHVVVGSNSGRQRAQPAADSARRSGDRRVYRHQGK